MKNPTVASLPDRSRPNLTPPFLTRPHGTIASTPRNIEPRSTMPSVNGALLTKASKPERAIPCQTLHHPTQCYDTHPELSIHTTLDPSSPCFTTLHLAPRSRALPNQNILTGPYPAGLYDAARTQPFQSIHTIPRATEASDGEPDRPYHASLYVAVPDYTKSDLTGAS